MIDFALQMIAPHHCYGCKKGGKLLCENCKYDIVSETFSYCINCLKPLSSNGVCRQCVAMLPYSRAWAVGERSDILRRLLDDFKFERKKATASICAQLLHETIPVLPDDTMVTYIPTSNRHIRQRGYDHAKLIAREFAKRRKLSCVDSLVRSGYAVQHGATRKQRINQANASYALKSIKTDTTYLLIDDIFTTGATVSAASRLLKDAGAKDVWLGIIARQPLDSRGRIW